METTDKRRKYDDAMDRQTPWMDMHIQYTSGQHSETYNSLELYHNESIEYRDQTLNSPIHPCSYTYRV